MFSVESSESEKVDLADVQTMDDIDRATLVLCSHKKEKKALKCSLICYKEESRKETN